MIAIPAIDLRDGACVQLVGGSFEDERLRLEDPLAVAARWRDAGFTRIHVVDLDAALGRGSNVGVVDTLLKTNGVFYQVGGGIRDASNIARWLARGSTNVVVGTRAIEDPDWLAAQASRWPGRLVLALDVRAGQVQLRGWSANADTSLETALRAIERTPLAGVLVTAVDVEGRLRGPDVTLIRNVRSATAHYLIAAGGIATLEDLGALETLGVNAAIIGMALYTGALDPAVVARRYPA